MCHRRLTERSSSKDRDYSSGDIGVRVLEVRVEFGVTVGNNGTDDSRIISEEKRPNGAVCQYDPREP